MPIRYGDGPHLPPSTEDSSTSDSTALRDDVEDTPDNTISLNVTDADHDHVTNENRVLLPSFDADHEEMVPTSSLSPADEDTPTESPSLSMTSSVVSGVVADDDVFQMTPGNLEEHYFIFWSTVPGKWPKYEM